MATPQELEAIFDRHRNNIYRLALSIVRNEKDAEDVLQNTLIKIMRKLDTFRNRSKISTWIYKVTYNESLMYLRKKYRQNRLSDFLNKPQVKSASGLFVNWSKVPDEELLDREFKQRLQEAINGIPIKYRMALLLHHGQRLALKEAAAVLGLKINSYKTRLHRAYLLTRAGMEDYFRDKAPESNFKEKGCGLWVKFIYDYALGDMGERMKRSFDKHINGCGQCKTFLGQYESAVRITRALECRDVPVELKDRIKSFMMSVNAKKNGGQHYAHNGRQH